MSAALEVDIATRLGQFDLAVRFTVPAAGVTALFGRSGAGKTSVINAIAGIASPAHGIIRMGADIWYDRNRSIDLDMAERAIGVVFQDAQLFPHLSVRANLRYGLKRALGRKRAGVIGFEEVVALLGLGELLARKPARLSGGERQRVALGRALLCQPRLLLMDEPLAALDHARKAEILPYIEQLATRFALPILYVTHSVAELTRLAQQVVILDEGRVVAADALVEIMANPQYATLLGRYEAGSVLECTVVSHDRVYELTRLAFPDGNLVVPALALATGSRLRVRLRARDVAIACQPTGEMSISNQLAGRVAQIVPRPGPYLEVIVAIGTTRIRALITRQAAERLALTPDLPVWALIKSVALDQSDTVA